jgi:FkbM family methyltransferase
MRLALNIFRHYGPRGFIRAAMPMAKPPEAPHDPGVENPAQMVDLGGLSFRVRANSTDSGIVEETRNVYLPKLAGMSFDSAIDIGAHVGGFSVQFAKQHPDTQIVAVEPEPENYGLLCENIRLNNVGVEAVNAAVSDEAGYAQLSRSTTNNTGGHHLTMSTWRESFRVATVDALDLVERSKGRILIKIDCEGWEVPILRRIRRATNVVAIVGELHTIRVATPSDAVRIMRGMGMTVQLLGPRQFLASWR